MKSSELLFIQLIKSDYSAVLKSTERRFALSTTFKNGNQIKPMIAMSINCRTPPITELVANIPLKNTGTVHGTDTPVGIGKIPKSITI